MMMYEMLTAKIHNARITACKLYYGGSITIDRTLMERAGLLPNQKVTVVNLNNGARLDTFVIPGEADSGTIELNGPAARLGEVDDTVHILAYALVDDDELPEFRTKFIHLDRDNRISREETKKCL